MRGTVLQGGANNDRDLNGTMGLVPTSQDSSQTQVHLDFIPERRGSG